MGRYAVPLFADYKNYYYLPKEDMAVHKSVGCFVEPAYRQKQLPLTATSKKTADFFRCRLAPTGILLFFAHPKRQESFIPWEENTELATDSVCHLINGFMHMPE